MRIDEGDNKESGLATLAGMAWQTCAGLARLMGRNNCWLKTGWFVFVVDLDLFVSCVFTCLLLSLLCRSEFQQKRWILFVASGKSLLHSSRYLHVVCWGHYEALGYYRGGCRVGCACGACSGQS